jgi:hypothetical protein
LVSGSTFGIIPHDKKFSGAVSICARTVRLT